MKARKLIKLIGQFSLQFTVYWMYLKYNTIFKSSNGKVYELNLLENFK